MRSRARSFRASLSLGLALLFSGCAFTGTNPSGSYYRVQQGDTLHEIGLRYGVSGQTIQELNGIDDPRKLRVGQVLELPRTARAATRRARDLSFAASTTPQATPESSPVRKVSLAGVRSYVGALALPVSGARVTSPFGWRSSRFHEGTDLAAPEGTPIRAAHEGKVVYVSEKFGGYGRVVVIKGDHLLTVYAHNSRNRVDVGDVVRKGDWIADVGQTGDASGPHVHFETRILDDSGRYAAVDPFNFISGAREVLQ